MVKAEIILTDGTKMIVDGTPEEILQIKESLEKKHSKSSTPPADIGRKPISDKGPLGRVSLLVQEGFFKEKRSISEIKSKLAEKAIFYDLTSLSPSVLRLVKRGELRRIKEEGNWRYVNP